MDRKLKLVFGALFSVLVIFYVSPLFFRPSNRSLADKALKADSESKRIEAAQHLISREKASVSETRRVALESRDVSVRTLCFLSLSRLYDYEFIDELFKSLESEDSQLRAAASIAIARLLGAEYGFRADSALDDRKKTAKRMRDDWETYKNSPVFESNLKRLNSKGE